MFPPNRDAKAITLRPDQPPTEIAKTLKTRESSPDRRARANHAQERHHPVPPTLHWEQYDIFEDGG